MAAAYLGVIYGSRTLGPAVGALLGNFCLKVYVSPGLEGDLKEGEDGWLGAWWLGFIIVGSSTLLIAPFLALFPQRLPDTREKTDAEALGLLEDFGVQFKLSFSNLYRGERALRAYWEGILKKQQGMCWKTTEEQSLYAQPDICRDSFVWVLWTWDIFPKVH